MRATLMVGLAMVGAALGGARSSADDAERKAIAYLEVEVPKWAGEHRCHSCHNNGDAARALYQAKGLGLKVDPAAMADTTAWLAKPERWDKGGTDGPGSDMRLARLQFAEALGAAIDSKQSEDRNALLMAADRLAADQAEDGSWPLEDGGAIGSPATYGPRLGTAIAVRTLRQADPGRHARRIARAEGWLRAKEVENVVEAAARLWIGPRGEAASARPAIDFLLEAQAKSGGWGPYRRSPIEPFDTALALLALAPHRDDPGVGRAVDRGREALIGMQLADGSWPETTRPAGADSYAQRLSTTGWATQALLATRR